jgi:thiamine-monophosphate kinase
LNLENHFISHFDSVSIGDDGAYMDGLVYSKDAFFENVHFKTKWMSHYQIASKAMLVNISDAVAMNAKPIYALLSVAMPKTITKQQMQDLAKGFKDVASEYSIEIIGGDTISNTKLDISITIISKTNKPLFRKGIKRNDLFAYTGDLGKSKKDLQKLLNGGRINKLSKFTNIKLRDKFVSDNRRYLNSGMDISDGLFSDLDKMLSINKIGAKFCKNIDKKVGCSGEEYEMLVAFDKRQRKTLLRRSKISRTKLTIFASAKRISYSSRCKANHF